MKDLRVIRRILKDTKADRIWVAFVLFVLVSGLIVWLAEPDIATYGDALWYCYAVITTVGFGDVVAVTAVVRVISVLLSAFAVLVIAIITGVIVNYYNQIVSLRQKETFVAFMDRLEHLTELSTEELAEMSEQVKSFRASSGRQR